MKEENYNLITKHVLEWNSPGKRKNLKEILEMTPTRKKIFLFERRRTKNDRIHYLIL